MERREKKIHVSEMMQIQLTSYSSCRDLMDKTKQFNKCRRLNNDINTGTSNTVPQIKTKNKQTNKSKLRQNTWCSFAEQLCFISVKVIIGTRVMCIF